MKFCSQGTGRFDQNHGYAGLDDTTAKLEGAVVRTVRGAVYAGKPELKFAGTFPPHIILCKHPWNYDYSPPLSPDFYAYESRR